MRKKLTTEETWAAQAAAYKEEAAKLPPGREREERLRMARRLETACQLDRWLSSPGLATPT